MRPVKIETDNHLFIGAHPDDIEINAGGTIAKLHAEGMSIYAVICSHSRQSLRGGESIASLTTLGIPERNIFFLEMDEPSIKIDLLIKEMELVVQRINPSVVYTHFHGDTHQDHVTVCTATMATCRFVPTIYMYHPTYPSGRSNVQATPNVFSLFTTKQLATKIHALALHDSQKHKYGDGNWLQSIASIAHGDAWRYAGIHGCAELFHLSRVTI